jgi:predicted SAM-dependent methyltransferase
MIDFNLYKQTEPLQVILGAGTQAYDAWISTNQEELDLLCPQDWQLSFNARLTDAFLCEHVWEHLTEAEGREAAKLCYKYLKPGGYLRCAVPDANFPNKS